MLADEVAAQREAEERSWRRWWVVAIVALLLAAFPISVYAASGQGHLDHMVGRSEVVTAQVESVQDIGYCNRPSRDKYEAELSWTTGGVSDHGSYTFCQDAPQAGDTIEAWVGPSGHVEIDSPTEYRIGLGAFGLGLGAIGGFTGGALVIMSQRRRRRLRAAAGRSLSSAVPIELARARTRGKTLRMRSAESASEHDDIHVFVDAVLYTRDDARPTKPAPRHVLGTWWLHRITPDTDERRRIGLLVRGQERCWIEFSI